jgi:hypothetical protein
VRFSQSNLFLVYGDYTDDGRPFYFGKGNVSRFRGKKRNKRHTRIANVHGQHRRLLVVTGNEQIAFHYEVKFIAQYKTNQSRKAEGHWGANFTDGGEGAKGIKRNAAWRLANSKAQKGKPKSLEARRNMSKAKRNWRPTLEHIAKLIAPHKGHRRSIEACAKGWETRRMNLRLKQDVA